MLDELNSANEVTPKIVAEYARRWKETPVVFANLLDEVEGRFDQYFQDDVQMIDLPDGKRTEHYFGLAVKTGVTLEQMDVFRKQLHALTMLLNGALPLVESENELLSSLICESMRRFWLAIDGVWIDKFSLDAMAELTQQSSRFFKETDRVSGRIYFDAKLTSAPPAQQTTTAGESAWLTGNANNRLMKFLLAVKNGETDHDFNTVMSVWTIEQFGEVIKRTKSSISVTEAWQTLQSTREMDRAKRRKQLRLNAQDNL